MGSPGSYEASSKKKMTDSIYPYPTPQQPEP